MELPQAFVTRMKTMLGSEYDAYIAQYDQEPVRGIRVNTLKLSKDEFLELCPWRVEQSDIIDEGLLLCDDVEHIGTDPYHIAGLFYVQEPSAMSVIEHSDIRKGMKVLDLCAAPGGKSGGIAARLNGTGLLVSNEVIPARAKQLAQNLERLGVMNAVVTNSHPDHIAKTLPHYFDRVVVDAPCSGEGMFRKDPRAISEWSSEHVSSCALRQRAILESAADSVAPDGKLIYSTCTFSQEENEGVIEAFLTEHPDFSLEMMKRYYPHTCRGEGHFVARLLRSHCMSAPIFRPLNRKPDKKSKLIVDEFCSSQLDGFPSFGDFIIENGRVFYSPMELPTEIEKLNILRIGVDFGELLKGRLKPAHALFMAMNAANELHFDCRNHLHLGRDSEELKRFLSGNTVIVPDELSGFVSVAVDGFPVGFGKAVDGTLKNHLPKGLNLAFFR